MIIMKQTVTTARRRLLIGELRRGHSHVSGQEGRLYEHRIPAAQQWSHALDMIYVYIFMYGFKPGSCIVSLWSVCMCGNDWWIQWCMDWLFTCIGLQRPDLAGIAVVCCCCGRYFMRTLSEEFFGGTMTLFLRLYYSRERTESFVH